MTRITRWLIAAMGFCITTTANAEWTAKKAPIMTRFAADVRPDNVLPDYPRPQVTRADWQNLNGLWEYQPGNAGDATPIGKTLAGQILVPFCVESALSGVMEHHDRLWYRRSFGVPTTWAGKRLLLHFGAVDYETEVFVNGKSVGTHRGGYDPFTFDITTALVGSGPQELIVRVFDPTNDGGQPRGKQSLRPGGIIYTPTTGIWQTVWLEPVAIGGIEKLKVTPDVDGDRVKLVVSPLGDAGEDEVIVTVKDGGRVIATANGKPGAEIVAKVPDAKLWSPDSPFLYDLDVTVMKNGTAIDQVGSYFGMRKIAIGDVGGVKKMLLNGKFVFEIGPLDQGFWPDGIYTPPSEAAIKNDIQITKDMGFNFIRKHIKVEPARWYYWCDHVGLMVWQDMPSANSYDDHPTPSIDKPEYESELTRIVDALVNVPSIIMWDTFNEGQGQFDTKRLVELVKKQDPTRLVNQASGGGYDDAGDVYDVHHYPPPDAPPTNDHMALACGEYGGIAFKVPGHMWRDRGGGYIDVQSPDDLTDLYAEFTNQLRTFRDERGLSAAVYTQLTDVETEINGLLTYDRLPKMDIRTIAKANRFELAPPTFTPIVATSEKNSQTWRFTTNLPDDHWILPTFDDKAWEESKGGFGAEGTPNIGKLGTDWKSSDIWLRRIVKLGDLSPEQAKQVFVRVYHDEDVQVYVNGIRAFDATGFNGRYENRPITEAAREALVPNADNVIAVHCRQTVGGQYVDVGLVCREPSTAGK